MADTTAREHVFAPIRKRDDAAAERGRIARLNLTCALFRSVAAP